MSERTTRRAAVAVAVFTAAVTLANAVLLVLGREALTNDEGDLFFDALIAIGGVLDVAIGLLIAVRARSVIGSFLAAERLRHPVRGRAVQPLLGRGIRLVLLPRWQRASVVWAVSVLTSGSHSGGGRCPGRRCCASPVDSD